MHDLYLFRTFYGAYQTFVNGYYVSATAYDRYATTQEQAVQDLHTLDDSLFYRTEQTSSWRTNADHFQGNFNEGLAYGYMPLSSYSSTYNSNIMAFYNKCGYSLQKHFLQSPSQKQGL